MKGVNEMNYTYKQGEKAPFVCNICAKGFTTEGGYVLHNRTHTKKDKVAKSVDSDKNCQHLWRILSSSNPVEKRAIAAKFSAVCTVCKEVK